MHLTTAASALHGLILSNLQNPTMGDAEVACAHQISSLVIVLRAALHLQLLLSISRARDFSGGSLFHCPSVRCGYAVVTVIVT